MIIRSKINLKNIFDKYGIKVTNQEVEDTFQRLDYSFIKGNDEMKKYYYINKSCDGSLEISSSPCETYWCPICGNLNLSYKYDNMEKLLKDYNIMMSIKKMEY